MQDTPETPEQCELKCTDAATAAGENWRVVVRFVCNPNTEKETIEFEPTKAQRWRLEVNRSYGDPEDGAELSSVRFHGRPDADTETSRDCFDPLEDTEKSTGPEDAAVAPAEEGKADEATGTEDAVDSDQGVPGNGAEAVTGSVRSPRSRRVAAKKNTDDTWIHQGGGLRGLFGAPIESSPVPKNRSFDFPQAIWPVLV